MRVICEFGEIRVMASTPGGYQPDVFDDMITRTIDAVLKVNASSPADLQGDTGA